MHSRVANQLVEALTEPVRVDGLACEGPLRVAAGTLSRAVGDEISATTVVGVLGADDIRAFEALVAQIADEFDFDARVRLHVGTFSVRFSRRSLEVFDAPPREGLRSRRPHLVERLALGIEHLMSGSARGSHH